MRVYRINRRAAHFKGAEDVNLAEASSGSAQNSD
jgi:hypothetical protein